MQATRNHFWCNSSFEMWKIEKVVYAHKTITYTQKVNSIWFKTTNYSSQVLQCIRKIQ